MSERSHPCTLTSSLGSSSWASWPSPARGTGDVEVRLPASRYLVKVGSRRCWGITDSPFNFNQPLRGVHLLAETLLSQYYVAADRGRREVGFAPVKDCARVGHPPSSSSAPTGAIVGGLFAVAAGYQLVLNLLAFT